MGKQPQEAATENQNAELSMRQATPPAMRRSAQLPTSSNAQQATRKNVRLLTNKNAQQAMKQATRSLVQQHTKRSAHLVGTAATTSARPRPRTVASRRGRRAGATEGSPPANGCQSSRARTSQSRSQSRSASLCQGRVALRCRESRASRRQRRAADRCQCRSQPRWRSKFALGVVLTGLEVATVATMAEKQSQTLCLVLKRSQ